MKNLIQFLVTILLFYDVKCNPCSITEAVDLSNGVQLDNGSYMLDDVEFTSAEWFTVTKDNVIVTYGCPCLRRTCVRKCCGSNKLFVNDNCTESDESSVHPFNPPVFNRKENANVIAKNYFYFLTGWVCDEVYFVDTGNQEEIYLQQDGRLYEITATSAIFHPSSKFCLDMVMDTITDTPRLAAVVCFPEKKPEESHLLHMAHAIGIILSVPFLLMTFFVYALVSELRNLHGMCLMAYCVGLIVAYSCLAYLKLDPDLVQYNRSACMTLSFVVYYSFLTSFFWVNVMCIDIWRTFSGGRSQNTNSSFHNSSASRRRELRRFAYYSAYAWGVPLLLTILAIVLQFVEDLPEHVLRPGFGAGQCWFSSWRKELAYFYGPIIILQICNCILFAITANKIRAVRQQTAILKGSESARSDKITIDKQRYALYLKLFIVMGINWSVELLSWAVGGSSWFWILTDLLNMGLGFFIFIIFVWKNKIRMMLMKRVHSVRRSHFSATDSNSRWVSGNSTVQTEDTRVSTNDDTGVKLKTLSSRL